MAIIELWVCEEAGKGIDTRLHTRAFVQKCDTECGWCFFFIIFFYFRISVLFCSRIRSMYEEGLVPGECRRLFDWKAYMWSVSGSGKKGPSNKRPKHMPRKSFRLTFTLHAPLCPHRLARAVQLCPMSPIFATSFPTFIHIDWINERWNSTEIILRGMLHYFLLSNELYSILYIHTVVPVKFNKWYLSRRFFFIPPYEFFKLQRFSILRTPWQPISIKFTRQIIIFCNLIILLNWLLLYISYLNLTKKGHRF